MSYLTLSILTLLFQPTANFSWNKLRHVLPNNDVWCDLVCVWERVDEKQTEITVSPNISRNIGILENSLNNIYHLQTTKKC